MALGAEEPPTGLQSYFCLTKQHKNLSWSLKAIVNEHPRKYRHLSKKWISLLHHSPNIYSVSTFSHCKHLGELFSSHRCIQDYHLGSIITNGITRTKTMPIFKTRGQTEPSCSPQATDYFAFSSASFCPRRRSAPRPASCCGAPVHFALARRVILNTLFSLSLV